MAGYDILMIAVLAGSTLWGMYKGMAWQLAALASLVASYYASYHLSDSLTSSGLFGQNAPWNRFAAMLTIYIITGIVIWMAFRVVSETIEKIKLKDFDRQLGALFGLVKGVIFCVLITFFVVTLMPTQRDQVINTRSGRYVAKLLSKAESIMPPELQTVLDPYIKRFEENLQPSNVAGTTPALPNLTTSNPQPWTAGMPNLPNFGNFGNQPNPNGSAPNPGNGTGYTNAPNIQNSVLNELGNVLNSFSNAPNQPAYNQPTFNQPAYSQPAYQPHSTNQRQGNNYGYPNPSPQNPYHGAGGQPEYSNPPLQPVIPQQAPYPQSFSPTPPAIDPPRYGEQGSGYQTTEFYLPPPPSQNDPYWNANVPGMDSGIR